MRATSETFFCILIHASLFVGPLLLKNGNLKTHKKLNVSSNKIRTVCDFGEKAPGNSRYEKV